MAVGDTLAHCTGTGTEADPYIFSDGVGFLEAIAVESAYVEAATNNMVIDSNDGVVVPTVTFNGTKLNGKGLTIRNLCVNATSTNILVLSRTGNISDVNFYNMCIIVSNTIGRFIASSTAGSSGRNSWAFNRCNFTGIYWGNYRPTNDSGIVLYMIGGRNYNSSWVTTYYFNKCTFNFNLKFKFTSSQYSSDSMNLRIFRTQTSTTSGNSDNVYLNNCEVKVTGSVTFGTTGSGKTFKIVEPYTYCSATTFLSDINNPLIIGEGGTLQNNPTAYGYSFYKLYAQAPTITISDSKGLIDTTRLTADTKNLTGIVMQETDDTQSDYIFNMTNLQTEGFLVGETIT